MPLRRTTSDVRPVPFSAKFQRVHPGTTGVTVLEHMERLDAVEAGLERLARHDSIQEDEDEEEQDVGDLSSSSSKPQIPAIVTADVEGSSQVRPEASGSGLSASMISRGSELPSVREADLEPPEEDDEALLDSPVDEADVGAMSKSMSYMDMEGTMGRRAQGHRWPIHTSEHAPRRSLDWMQEDSGRKRMVISEVSLHLYVPVAVALIVTGFSPQRLEMIDKKPLFSRCGF